MILNLIHYNIIFSASQWQGRRWHPTFVLVPRESHGRRSLVGCSPWGREELDTTEQLHFHFHFHALEKEMATHSGVLAWRIPGMAEPGGLPSIGSRRVGHDWSDLVAAAAAASQWKPLRKQSTRKIDGRQAMKIYILKKRNSQFNSFKWKLWQDRFKYQTILQCFRNLILSEYQGTI